MAVASEQYCSTLEGDDTMLEDREMRQASDSKDFDEGESVVCCACRSQCTRKLKTSKSGKVTGCPCRDRVVRCGRGCSYGSKEKPCRNKDISDQQERGLSGQNQGREGAGTSGGADQQPDVDEMLDHATLLEVSKQSFQSRGLFLKDLITKVQTGTPPTPRQPAVPSFCVCGHCRLMPTDREQVCCKERRLCRSRTAAFQNICVDGDNLATVIRSLADTYVFTLQYDNRGMRHAAYRQYIMWQHGHLGRGHRKVIPSCCVWEIRNHYPSPNGQYSGYKDR